MTGNRLTYHVENDLVDSYIKKSGKRMFYVFFTVLVIIITSQALIVNANTHESNVLLIPIIGMAVTVCAIALFFSIRLFGNKLRTFAGAGYSIQNDILSQQIPGNEVRQFRFKEIAVIHQKSYGTIIVKGGHLTKLNYYRPKRNNPYPLDSANVIFVPTITTNYSELISSIQQLTKEAK